MDNRIKTLRKRLGLTQAAFGERIGLKKSSVSQIESGINNLSNGIFISICREFHVNETWLRFLATHMCFTNAKARRELGFQPTHTTEEAITETAIWTHNRQG